MTHLWVRAETRANETRVGITPKGVSALMDAGFQITVERSPTRCIDDTDYEKTGARMVDTSSWPSAPRDAIICGLKELPEDGTALEHRHIMFGHAFKGQSAGKRLLSRFKAGGGTLLDLEYLTDADGRRLAAFGYWAGYAGAAITLRAWAAQRQQRKLGPISPSASASHLLAEVQSELVLTGANRPDALIIGANGRVGTGVADFCTAMGALVTAWDMAETASGGPFPEVLNHPLFFNCVVALPGTPVFVQSDAAHTPRKLRVIGDIACDPDSDFSPVRVYDSVTDWETPTRQVHNDPPLEVMAIDNLPSLLPVESSEDFAGQLLPVLEGLADDGDDVWERAKALFKTHLAEV